MEQMGAGFWLPSWEEGLGLPTLPKIFWQFRKEEKESPKT